ncbi:MAG: hypothetical protein NZM04_10455, partial [Methylacidiphilales bacterium]|nr:hypothetical protein [Candidatus Methylacidiphilales bacterium]
MSRQWNFVSALALYLPAIFYFTHHLIQKPNFRNTLTLSLIQGLCLLQGNASNFFYTFVFSSLYTFSYLFKKARNASPKSIIIYFTLALVLSLIIALPLLIPLYQATRSSVFRPEGKLPLEEILHFTVNWSEFLQAQIGQFKPRFFLTVDSTMLFHACSWPLVPLGILALVLSPQHVRRLWPYFILILLSTLLVSDWYRYFYSIPGFGTFRWPLRIYPYAIFFGISLIALFLLPCIEKLKTPFLTLMPTLLFTALSINLILLMFFRIDYNLTKYAKPQRNSFIPIDTLKNGRILTYEPIGNILTAYDPSILYGFSFPTLYTVDGFGGFDALLNRNNHRVCAELNYDAYWTAPLDQQTLDHLSQWSVRYLITNN